MRIPYSQKKSLKTLIPSNRPPAKPSKVGRRRSWSPTPDHANKPRNTSPLKTIAKSREQKTRLMSYQKEAVITSRLLRLRFVVVHDVISHTQLQQKQEDDQPTDPNPKEAHRDGHGQKNLLQNSRRTNHQPTPKKKQGTTKKRIYRFVSSMGQSIFSSYWRAPIQFTKESHPLNTKREPCSCLEGRLRVWCIRRQKVVVSSNPDTVPTR